MHKRCTEKRQLPIHFRDYGNPLTAAIHGKSEDI